MALRAVTSNGVAITPSSLTVSGTLTGSSGTATAASISPTINQSGTAGYTAFDVNPTETATGSGTKLLQRWAVAGTAVANLSNTGLLSSTAIATLNLYFGATLGGADTVLTRDATNVIAQRNSTAAQGFRLYNTYTDASNFERLALAWGSNIATISTDASGTGAVRVLRINGSTLSFMSGGTQRWNVNGSGHFLAEVDNTYDIGASGATRPRALYLAGGITHGSATLLTTTTALTNGAAAATGTLTNAPTAGNPTKWIPINDNGTTRYIPAW